MTGNSYDIMSGRFMDELGCSREDDPLETARARMQEIKDGDAELDRMATEIAELKNVLSRSA